LALKHFSRLTFIKYSSDIFVIIFAFIYSYFAANLLGPESYGLVSLLIAFISGIPLMFGFEAFQDLLKVYIPRTRSKKLFTFVLKISSLMLFITLILVILFSGFIYLLINKGSPEIISTFSILIFIIPFSGILQSVIIGFKGFGKLLKLSIVEKTFDVTLFLIFFFVFDQGFMAVFYSKIVSILTITVLSFYFIRHFKFENKNFNMSEIKKFSYGAFFANIFKGLMLQAELLIFGMLLSLEGYGVFYLLKRIATYAFETPNNALSEVMLPFISEEKDSKKIDTYVSLVIKFQLLLGILILILFMGLLPVLLFYIFPAYFAGYLIAPIIAIGFVLNISSPLIKALRVANKNNYIGGIFILSLLFIVTAGVAVIPIYGLIGAALIFSTNKILISFTAFVFCLFCGIKVSIIPRKKDVAFFKLAILSLFRRKKQN